MSNEYKQKPSHKQRQLIPVIRDEATILMREGVVGRTAWRQYLVISDERIAIVHMVPALFGGWKFDRVEVQGSNDWPRMTRDQIVAWKQRADDGRTRVVDTDFEPFEPEFRVKLLARAGFCAVCGALDAGHTCCPPSKGGL